jgi:GAF domain-containing protein
VNVGAAILLRRAHFPTGAEVGVKAEDAVVEDITQLVSHSGNPTETLTSIVDLIRQRFSTDVCSVYVLEQDRANLVLAATVGLRPESVGQVRMRVTEGLAGLVAEQAKPVVVPMRPHIRASSSSATSAKTRIARSSGCP